MLWESMTCHKNATGRCKAGIMKVAAPQLTALIIRHVRHASHAYASVFLPGGHIMVCSACHCRSDKEAGTALHAPRAWRRCGPRARA